MGDIPLARCEADRQRLAQLDSDREFRELMDEANRANASFYPIDPRGLAVFDTPLVRTDVPGPLPPIVPPHIDQATLKAREGSLRAAAALTDGMVVVGSNDLATGLKRITNDLSSYYLLGYYSSGKLDGKFHAISVRVKRPGVHVRARRGYLAGRAGDVANSVGGVAAPASAGASSIAAAATSAIAALTVSARDQPLRLHVVAGWKNGPDSKPAAVFWTVGEITDRISGADLDAVVTTADGSIVGSMIGRVVPGVTSAMLAVAADRSIEPGPYQVRLRSRTGTGSETLTTDVALPPASASSGAVFVRRGPSTGNKDAATADFRFRRSDRLRVEFPTGDAAGTTARLLDRTGKPMPVPVLTAMRHDPDGTHWTTAELALMPLAPGDYVIEIAGGSETRMVAFRVVP